MYFSGKGRRRMKIDPIVYMEWAKSRPLAKINLSRSGLPDRSFDDLNLERADLDINGEHPYGYPPLIEAIASRYRVDEKNVLPTLGASQAVFITCAVLLEPGDEVLIEKPAYEPLLAVPRFFKADIKRFERKFEDGYMVDLDHFQSLISPRTKLVVLTNLHNPSGVLLSPAALKKLALAAAEEGAMVLVDEIYLEFLDGKETAFHGADNVIIASSLTKAYGLGGLRCGWILAPSFLTEKMRRFMDHDNVEGVFIGEQISAKVFNRLDSIQAKNKPDIEKNLALVRDFIRREKKLRWVEPAHGIVCFPRIEARLDGGQLARLLQEKYETSVVPGYFFEEPKHFRLGYGVPIPVLKQGLENIRSVLQDF
jgi:aspartate/methionine/tyrosine aminotransferase